MGSDDLKTSLAPAASAPVDTPDGARRLIQLDVRDTTILKGLAISAIVLHNFFHAVSPAHENEFVFHPGGLEVFLNTVIHPALAFQAMFSFFGYLGVPVFIFLSAYGLSRSHWDSNEGWVRFMAGRIRKLYPIFGLVVLPWMFVDLVHTAFHPFLHDVVPQIAYMVAGLTPFIPGLGLPPVGPWWFIPFIVEFYAMFYLLRWMTNRFGRSGLVALALLCVLVTMLLTPVLNRWAINLYETPLGHMPSICLGIAAARYPIRVPLYLGWIAMAVLLAGSEFSAVWPLTFCAAAVASLCLYMEFRTTLRSSRWLEQIGRYSILIFLINGIVRDCLLGYATTSSMQLAFGALSAVISFAIAAIIHEWLLPSAAQSRRTAAQEPARC